MNYTTLSLEQSPPLAVPMRYFLTAPVFMVAAAWLALLGGPEIFTDRWSPMVLALTHWLTLGFMAMVMFGAVQQLLPVLLGTPLARPLLVSRVLHLLLTLGSALLGVGLIWPPPFLLQTAILLLGLVFGLFILFTLRQLWRSRSTHASRYSMSLAVIALALTVVLGLYLAAGHGWNGLTLARRLTGLHLAWGLLGWTVLLISGVAYQVIPMFQITPAYPRPLMHWLGPLLFGSLLLLTLAAMSGSGLLPAVLAVSLVLLGFAGTTLWLLQRRRRRLPDVTLSYWRLSMSSLVAVVLLWLGHVLLAWPVPVMVFGILLIIGFAISAISGMLYKIVPFLVWLNLNTVLQGQGRPQGGIPNMKQVITPAWAKRQYLLHLLSLLLWLAAAMYPDPLSYAAALALLLSAALLWCNMLAAARVYRRYTRKRGHG